jgi:hypothetical protein
MIAIYFLLGLVIILQTLVLVGICRTNNKLNELGLTISTLNDLIVPAIGAYTKSISYIVDQLTDISTGTKKKHKKKKGETFYADNESES